MNIKFQKLSDSAKVPTYGHDGDAGLDLYVAKEAVIEPGERSSISTGIALEIPVGYVGLIWEKSGLAFKKGIATIGGVIDAPYRGEIMVGIRNDGKEAHSFQVGDKVAQLLIQPVQAAVLVEGDLLDTSRGADGFGSTGV